MLDLQDFYISILGLEITREEGGIWRTLIFIECLLCSHDALHICYSLSSKQPWPQQTQPHLSSCCSTLTDMIQILPGESIRFSPNTGILHLAHFLMTFRYVSSQADRKPQEGTAECHHSSTQNDTSLKARRTRGAVTCPDTRLGLTSLFSPTNTKRWTRGKAFPQYCCACLK